MSIGAETECEKRVAGCEIRKGRVQQGYFAIPGMSRSMWRDANSAWKLL